MISEGRYRSYIEFTRTTAKYPSFLTGERDELCYLALGLYNEYGEYLEKKTDMKPPLEVQSELSDVCWYLFRLFDALAFDLPHINERPRGVRGAGSLFVRSSAAIAGVIKKVLRDGADVHGDTEKRMKLYDHLSNCMLALGCMAFEEETSLGKLLDLNQKKLSDRLERGVLCGDGDHR